MRPLHGAVTRPRLNDAKVSILVDDMKKAVVVVIVALVAILVLVSVFADEGRVTVCVYADGDGAYAALDAAKYAIEPLGGDVEGEESYIAAACTSALRREGIAAQVEVKTDGSLVIVRLDGSTTPVAQSAVGAVAFGLERLAGGIWKE